jgi:hypothetical protein
MARPTKREREEQEAKWIANEQRVKALGNLFSALPRCPEVTALHAAMSDRIIDLYNEMRFEEGDAILEFLPNEYARKLLDWYFHETDTFPSPSTAGEHEAAQQGTVQSEPQQPCGADGQRPRKADQEIIELAGDLVALWESPKIQSLSRADRNSAISDVRSRLIKAVKSA